MRLLLNSRVVLLVLIFFTWSCRHKKDMIKKNNVVTTNHADSGLKEKLGISAKEIKENKLFRFVEDWYGVPYKYGGCVKTGVDCSCFADNIYEHVYGRKIARNAVDIYSECDKITKEKLREGDFIFFKINSGSISHVGVYLKNNKFAHATTSKGVRVDDLDDAYYTKYFYSCGRLKHSS